jgi:hypothetical protein
VFVQFHKDIEIFEMVRFYLLASMSRPARTQQFLKSDNSPNGLFWNSVCQDDRKEFIRLQTLFHHEQKNPVKDRRLVSFFNELQSVLEFTERSASGFEERCLLAGIAFGGSFICVNTQQLKAFVGRCKSSINGSFQQLGYAALKTKQKAKACLLLLLPSLANEVMAFRQWTVRYASQSAQFCFISRYRPRCLPDISEADLQDEKKGQQAPVESPPVFDHGTQSGSPDTERQLPVLPVVQVISPMPALSTFAYPALPTAVVHPPVPLVVSRPPPALKFKKLAFDLSGFDDEDEAMKVRELKPSFSSGCLSGYDSDDAVVWAGPWNPSGLAGMPRSRSTKWSGRDLIDGGDGLLG